MIGCAAFFACAVVSQYAQSLCRLSTRTPLVPHGINVATVCAGSMLAHGTTTDAEPIPYGVAAFLLLGGRTLSFTPSSIIAVGAFGRSCLNGNVKYAILSQRKKIANLGRRFGCHTCGKRGGSFVADHQPPLEVIKNRSWLLSLVHPKYKYYPQCHGCSSKQASVLRWNKRNHDARVTHFLTLRPYHLTGALVSPLVQAKDEIFSSRAGGKKRRFQGFSSSSRLFF